MEKISPGLWITKQLPNPDSLAEHEIEIVICVRQDVNMEVEATDVTTVTVENTIQDYNTFFDAADEIIFARKACKNTAVIVRDDGAIIVPALADIQQISLSDARNKVSDSLSSVEQANSVLSGHGERFHGKSKGQKETT